MFVFDHPSFDDHEGVHAFADPASGLKAIVAIHSTARGPASGGCRLWSYVSEDAAIDDVLRLSKGMSYKNAMANLDLGGGKAVIIKPEGEFNRTALFTAFGKFIDQLGGRYITAEDVGVSPADMEIIHAQTPYVAGLNSGEAASGDPSPITAEGVYRGMRAAVQHRLGRDGLNGLTVAVQGIGHVGYALCEHVHKAGARLIVTDINTEALQKARDELGAVIVAPNDIYRQQADIFAPCALGRAINPDTLPQLKVKIVAGAANNQLSTPEMGAALHRNNILFAPDYVINAGGIINIASEISGTYDPAWVASKLDELEATTRDVFAKAERAKRPTNEIADDMARQRLGRA
ncbi:Leu/Phe/Val dehydrogenase [Robiginitomaculum antarcticum]|uniref:Leu/Phe/Val dehydrogenase n=1 Tax=Robiginitomaculum antarcticum TaxID=437507 RepID=UPI00035DB917|nr:Glu/Leu/Phe/Val dehydrogenase [Robiginitomaculum antarcticum]